MRTFAWLLILVAIAASQPHSWLGNFPTLLTRLLGG